MKKRILWASLALAGLANAQSNEQLAKLLENNKNLLHAEYDFYVHQKVANSPLQKGEKIPQIDSLRATLLEKKNRLAFIFEGHPYYYKNLDTDQIKNNKVEAIHNGQIAGLSGNFQGQGIKVSIFDGGRVYENHSDFGGIGSLRVTNRETSSINYSSHATGVAGIIGGQGTDISRFRGNSKGMLPLAQMDSYYFSESTLVGDSRRKSVNEKFLGSLAYLSNHSYGIYLGWEKLSASSDNAGAGWYWMGDYNPTTKQSIHLNGTYYTTDRDYDEIVYNNPSMIAVKAAGNSYGDGPAAGDRKFYISDDIGNINGYKEFTTSDIIPEVNCANGYDCIANGSLAKNLIIVGAAEKITTNGGQYTQASDVIKADYSSAGPRDDGGIKPDITAVGSDVITASTNTTGSDRWQQGNGTSFASPQITGIIGLWLEIYKSLNNNQMFNAASAKTLLIHTAMEAGNIGPDVHFGWGFADAKAGAELIVAKSNDQILFEEKTLQNRATESILLESDGTQPLKVSISWLDPAYRALPNNYQQANNNRASVLINDFDLRITNINTHQTYYPWKLDINQPLAPATQGDNLVDNVEQVWIPTPAAGIYKVEISHKGDLKDNNGGIANSQNYSLIATGYRRIVNPDELNRTISTTPSGLVVSPTLISDTDRIVSIQHNEQIEGIGVYDMAGRLLYSAKANGTSHNIDFGRYVQGIYVIEIKLANGDKTSKKVIRR